MEFQVVKEVRDGDGDEDDEIFKKFGVDLVEKFSALNLNYSVPRSSGMSERARGESNSQEPINPQQHVLAVAPLNSMPYIGPPGDINSSPTEGGTEAVERVGPAMIFLPSHSTREEWEKLTASTISGVALTGSAALGKVGPIIGLMDIAESEDSYYFRVSLPGVARDKTDFRCDIEPDGKIFIKGVTTTGEKIVCKNSQIFKMLKQNLCPPVHFSISFQLPGPVDHQLFSGHFVNGILEGIVKKKK